MLNRKLILAKRCIAPGYSCSHKSPSSFLCWKNPQCFIAWLHPGAGSTSHILPFVTGMGCSVTLTGEPGVHLPCTNSIFYTAPCSWLVLGGCSIAERRSGGCWSPPPPFPGGNHLNLLGWSCVEANHTTHTAVGVVSLEPRLL